MTFFLLAPLFLKGRWSTKRIVLKPSHLFLHKSFLVGNEDHWILSKNWFRWTTWNLLFTSLLLQQQWPSQLTLVPMLSYYFNFVVHPFLILGLLSAQKVVFTLLRSNASICLWLPTLFLKELVNVNFGGAKGIDFIVLGNGFGMVVELEQMSFFSKPFPLHVSRNGWILGTLLSQKGIFILIASPLD